MPWRWSLLEMCLLSDLMIGFGLHFYGLAEQG